jgi:O-glycosyl hydrolase
MAKKTENRGNISGRQSLLLSAWGHLTVLLLTSLITTVVEGATGTVDINTVYQQLEGFGGAIGYEPETLVGRSYRETVYDYLFRDLGLDVIRIKNTYGISSSFMTATGTIVAEANERADANGHPRPKIELVPWSPPAYLKSNNDVNGGPTGTATLKGGPSNYVYDSYATWWANSVTESNGWGSVGIHPDYISIQNEPDWGYQDQACRFAPTQNSSYAGYDQAFEHVFQELYSRMGSSLPKMIGPETMGYGGSQAYIDALINEDHVYGFSFHPYSDAGGESAYDNPDSHLSGMDSYAADYGYKPLFQTEYCRIGQTPNFDHAVKLAWHIHNFLYHMGVTSYYHWTLFRGYGTGGLINVTNPSSYTVSDLYWFFKAYTYFTDPNWYVVRTSLSGVGSADLRMSAFKNPDSNQLTVVILNKASDNPSLTLTLNGFTQSSSEVYRSSASDHWVSLGTFSNPISLPALSITTIHLTGTSSPVFSNCAAVRAAGYGLISDIYPDCYVNYKDLEIIADYWLSSDCGWLNNYCDGADFKPRDGNVDFVDFSKFAVQWMQCNDPNNPGCEHNW